MAALVNHVGLVPEGKKRAECRRSATFLLSSTRSRRQSSAEKSTQVTDRPRFISLVAPHWRCYSNIISDTFLFVLSLSGYRRAAFKPQQIASVTLNACEQIALWKRKRAPAATSASRLWLEMSLHYTSSKTYPLFMGPYFNTISTLHNHPPKYLHVSNQRSVNSQSYFALAEISGLGLRKWRRLHQTRLNLISGLIKSLQAVNSHIPWKILRAQQRNFAFFISSQSEALCAFNGNKGGKSMSACTQQETHEELPPVWVGGVATQQLSETAYGCSNWVEQHSWRTPVQDLASGNQSHNPQPCSAHSAWGPSHTGGGVCVRACVWTVFATSKSRSGI